MESRCWGKTVRSTGITSKSLLRTKYVQLSLFSKVWLVFTTSTIVLQGIEVEGLIHSKTLEKRDIAFVPMEIGAAIDAIIAAHGKAVIAHMPTLGTKWLKLMNDNVPSLAKRGEALNSEQLFVHPWGCI